jgi:hypothetical protein
MEQINKNILEEKDIRISFLSVIIMRQNMGHSQQSYSDCMRLILQL